MAIVLCSITGCARPVSKRGWCNAHYLLWYRHGDPTHPGQRYRPTGMDPVEWFWSGFARVGNGCLEWQRGRYRAGYGSCPKDLGDGSTYSHRVAWVLTNGPVPMGLHVLHRCDNPPCGDPAHLFLGTNDDNIRDRMAKGR